MSIAGSPAMIPGGAGKCSPGEAPAVGARRCRHREGPRRPDVRCTTRIFVAARRFFWAFDERLGALWLAALALIGAGLDLRRMSNHVVLMGWLGAFLSGAYIASRHTGLPVQKLL